MIRQHVGPVAAFAVAMGLLVILSYALGFGRNSAGRHPRTMDEILQTLQEVARVADDLQLHHRSDVENGELRCRLIVSERTVTYQRANDMRIGEPEHPCWKGTVAVCAPLHSYLHYLDANCGVVWGEVFLYGDPALIRMLVAARPQGVRPSP
jgi:hypothetical protein